MKIVRKEEKKLEVEEIYLWRGNAGEFVGK